MQTTLSSFESGEPVLDPTILPGDSVRWVWDQGFHNTTAAAGQLESWDSGVQSGGTFARVFAVPWRV